MSSTPAEVAVEVDHDEAWLTIRTPTFTRRLPAIWLRDNIPSGRHRVAGQRTFDITELPLPVTIVDAGVVDGGVRVEFGDGTVDAFPLASLEETSLPSTHRLWNAELENQLVGHDYRQVLDDQRARLAWCVDLRDLGVALLRGAPTDHQTVVEVTELFGFVRQTNYGTTFDVRVEADPSNLAFTSVEIGPHTDNPYRDPVPGIQLLHCLINESSGGLTRLTDGFAVLAALAERDPDSVTLLETHPVTFEYVDHPNSHLRARRPLIERDADGELVGIRYNSRSVAPFDLPDDLLADFYAAYRELGRWLADPRFRIDLRLEPGDVLALDNRRILHGRSGFDGHRHLVGCYADHDALESTIRVLDAELDQTDW